MQRIFITGCNRGLGLEMVRQYAQHEDTLIFATCRNPAEAHELNQLAADRPNQITVIPFEVGNESVIPSVVELVSQKTDSLDILINNAGMNPHRPSQDFGLISSEMMLETFQVNAVAPLMIVRAFLDLLKRGNQPRVINLTSQVGSMTWKVSGGRYAYATSKAALNMVTRCLAADLQPFGIITIMVHPGWVQTDMGGSSAPLTPEDAVNQLQHLIESITAEDNGKFFKWNGEIHPW